MPREPLFEEMSPKTVVIALGSNLGDRRYNLLRAVHALHEIVRVVRVSAIHESAAVDAPAGSPPFLNMVIVGHTTLEPEELLKQLLTIERRLGRAPRRVRNEPRIIDLDLIVYSGRRVRTPSLTVPHPRAHERAFVIEPLAEVSAVKLARS